jgi:hypothetical protein
MAMSMAAAFQSVARLLAPQVAAPWGSFCVLFLRVWDRMGV